LSDDPEAAISATAAKIGGRGMVNEWVKGVRSGR